MKLPRNLSLTQNEFPSDAMKVLIISLVVGVGWGLATGQAAAAEEQEKVAAFISRQESALLQVKQKLLAAAKRTATDVARSDLPPGEKQILLAEIDRDRASLEKDGKLPNSDVLLPAVVEVLDDYQKMFVRLEKLRQAAVAEATRKSDADALAKITAFEERLETIVGGREHFKKGSVWTGEFAKHGLGRRGKKTVDQVFDLHLTINDVQSNTFHGELKQTANIGRASVMDVSGTLTGNKIGFDTGQMTRGKERDLAFDGYLLSDRIILRSAGKDATGYAASGWVSLWREGSDKVPAKQRGKRSGT